MDNLTPVPGIDIVQDEHTGWIFIRDQRSAENVRYYPIGLEATSGNMVGVALSKVDNDGDYVELFSYSPSTFPTVT